MALDAFRNRLAPLAAIGESLLGNPRQGAMSIWTDEMVESLRDLYPRLGVQATAEVIGLTIGQVRGKASRLGLRCAGISEAWRDKQATHAEKLRGRKRPEQSQVILTMHADGRLKKTPEQRRKIGDATKARIKENGHPRGALGMTHTPETKARLRETSAAAYASLTEEAARARSVKGLRTRVANGTAYPERPGGTWKAGWREIGGVRKYYRSRWEANYARFLQWMLERGEISWWAHEPKTFWFNGIRRGAVSYLPDFHVVEASGSEAYHEVKGWMDARSKTKIKRMAKYYPDVRLVVIDSKAYRKLAGQIAALIDGWE